MDGRKCFYFFGILVSMVALIALIVGLVVVTKPKSSSSFDDNEGVR